MNSISEEMLLRDGLKYKFEEITPEQDSYWKCTDSDYGVEEYDFVEVDELMKKIEKATRVCSECAKCMAVEAFQRQYIYANKKSNEKQEIEIPDFVYRL